MKYRLERDPEGGIIPVNVQLDGRHTFKMVLDTGASRTTIDTTALYMAGYNAGNTTETSAIETANGIVEVKVFKVNSLTALGHTKCHLPVQVYDFLAHGILSDYDGLLGLDFFEDTTFCIDMANHMIEIIPCSAQSPDQCHQLKSRRS
jgi:predicted aspartyl protease